MNFFKSIKSGMDNAKEKKNILQESRITYKGMTMQPIGKIPEQVEATLNLRPSEEKLVIAWMNKEITLPYDRIIDFNFSVEIQDSKEGKVQSAKEFLRNSNIAGKALSTIIPSNSKITIDSVLEYYDKEGTRRNLRFYTTDSREHYDIDDLFDILDGVDSNERYEALNERKFQEALRRAVSRGDTDIEEL